MSKKRIYIIEQYKGLFSSFSTYWNVYGCWKGLIFSPYFHFALFLSISSLILNYSIDWSSIVLSVMPSILGFTLGGYAFLLGVGDESFRNALRGKQNGKYSPFMVVNATFAHFIILQLFSVLFAIIAKVFNTPFFLFDFIGIFLFFYSLTTSLAAVFAIFKLAHWYDTQKTLELENKTSNK